MKTSHGRHLRSLCMIGVLAGGCTIWNARADDMDRSVTSETTGESKVEKTAEEAAHDAKKNAKKATRKIKDKTCEMVNGKMECTAKKIKHKAQNAMDEAKDKVD
jgi:hypothetical protein